MSRIDWVATLSRVFCGVTFIIHGTPKIMDLDATTQQFAAMGFPGWLAIPVALFEFFGGIVLLAGFLSRILAGLFIGEMIVAGIKVHLPHGWDVYHFGDPMARGYEYVLALIILLLVVVLLGAGPVSVDAALSRRRGTDRGLETDRGLGERGSV